MNMEKILELIERADEYEIAQVDELNFLNGLGINQLPSELEELTNLVKINLSDNKFKEIPQLLTNLPTLRILSMSGNRLKNLCPETLSKLIKITTLYLNRNDLSDLPPIMAEFQDLTELNLWGNQFPQIPESIRSLTKLAVLEFGNNQLQKVPEWIGELTNLKVLNLNQNNLTEIPNSIGQIDQLSVLDLSENQLTKIPKNLSKLTNLVRLDLRGNPLPIDDEILEKWGEPQVILDACFK